MAARTALSPETNLSKRKIEVVQNDQQVAERNIELSYQFGNRDPASVHIRPRFNQDHAVVGGKAHLEANCVFRPALSNPVSHAGEFIEHPETNIVSCIPVT